jgi:hypothetical protein
MTWLTIGIGLCFYQDFDSLIRFGATISQFPFDYLLAIDGRYKEFPDKQGLSSDRTRALINSLHNKHTKVKLIDAPNLTQNDKRQLYFDYAAFYNIDALLIMDSDEFIITSATNWQLFTEDLYHKITTNETYRQAYCIPTLRQKTRGIAGLNNDEDMEGDIQNLPRLFVRPGELRYVDNHYTIRHKQTGVAMTYDGNSVCQHIMMGHDHNMRDAQYQLQSDIYQRALVQLENEIRHKREREQGLSV